MQEDTSVKRSSPPTTTTTTIEWYTIRNEVYESKDTMSISFTQNLIEDILMTDSSTTIIFRVDVKLRSKQTTVSELIIVT